MTYWDLGVRSRDESWRRVRASRSNPPGGAGLERAAVYDAALEQAQQQFLAAAGIGYDSRPLNLFYGLSQAGRALATVLARADESYELRGHGISSPNLEDVSHNPHEKLVDLTVRSDGRRPYASFTRLSQLLNSPLVEQPVPMARLWGMLVEPQLHEPLAPVNFPVLMAEGRTMSGDPQTFAIEGISGIPVEFDGIDSSGFDAFLGLYPALRDVQFHRQTGRSEGRDKCPSTLSIEVRVPIEREDPGPLGIDYRGSLVILPAVAGSEAMHPLMIWWSVLYPLSMLARYQPRAWVELIDVSRSEYAVAIEYLLDVAQDSVPDLVARTIEEAHHQPLS
jgi:YaaC-like Protein